MKKVLRLQLLLVSFITFLSSCSIPAAQVKPLDGSSVKVERPVWQVGDSWTYQTPEGGTTRTDQVVRRDGEEYVLKRGEVDQLRLTPGLSLKQILVSGEATDDFTPAIDYFQWPLEVGKPWRVECDCKRKGTPNLLKVLANVTVESYEQVTVPAGSFPAFRVYYKDGFGRAPYIYWYAPSVKNWVRWEDYREKTVWELKSFQLAKGQ